MELYEFHSASQESNQFQTNVLDATARRLLLGSMLRLLTRRYRRGQPMLRHDLRQLMELADDARSSGARK